jgi:ribosomal protein S18 acetylase RimI-like enzyme
MQNPLIYELVGYLASVLIAISVMNTNVLRLRLFNTAGAAFFTAYGFLIKAWPVAGLNLFIVCVNVFHLYRIFRSREYFKLLEVKPDSAYLNHFLSHYLRDIRKYIPGYEYSPSADQLTLFVLRNTVPAGVFIAQLRPNGDLHVQLDYVTPDYRDLKVGEFLLHQELAFFRARGVRRIISPAGTGRHAEYLKKMGFIPMPAPDADTMMFARSVA